MIKYRLLPDGGFVAGDTDSSRTAYAYPTSPYAEDAAKRPALTAHAMINDAIACTSPVYIQRDYDARNWALLAEVAA